MRLLLLLPLLAATTLAAQSIEINGLVTTSTSRGNFATGAGEVVQGFHESHWKGLGDTGAGAFLNGIAIVTQDQNASTPEVYDLVVRLGTDAAGPDPLVTGELCSIIGLTTPPSTVLTPQAWILTSNFAAPCRIRSKGHLSVGVRLPPAPLWNTDGQSVHICIGRGPATQQQSDLLQEDHAWQIIGGVVSHPSVFRSWRVRLLFSTPILQNGTFATTTASYSRSMGGMFPSSTGTHGWSTHVDGGTPFAGGVTGIFLSPVVNNPGLVLPGIRGSVYLGSPLIAVATLPLSATGTADLSIVDPAPFVVIVGCGSTAQIPFAKSLRNGFVSNSRADADVLRSARIWAVS